MQGLPPIWAGYNLFLLTFIVPGKRMKALPEIGKQSLKYPSQNSIIFLKTYLPVRFPSAF